MLVVVVVSGTRLSCKARLIRVVVLCVCFAALQVPTIPLMAAYLTFAGSEREEFVSSVNSASCSLGDFMGKL